MADIKTDAPGLLRTEALQIELTFTELSSTTGRISWNIPIPAAGCDANTQAYCGMLITIRTNELPVPRPIDGKEYVADISVDTNMFAGNKIGDSLVVGAVYADRETEFVDIEDLDPHTAYYISGFPVDCQLRYFRPGVHAYSESGKFDVDDATGGKQIIQFNPPDGPGITDDDLTGLIPGEDYSFELQVGRDPVRPIGVRVNHLDCIDNKPQLITINVKGAYNQTYGDLINTLNLEFMKKQGGILGQLPPRAGTLYWNGQTLYDWDGYQLNDTRAYVRTTDPRLSNDGELWLVDGILYQYDETNNDWDIVQYINGTADVSKMFTSTVWFNGDLDNPEAAKWSGITWCESNIAVSTVDPKTDTSGWFTDSTFWFNTKHSLFQWNVEEQTWTTVTNIVQSSVDPNNVVEYLWYDNLNFHKYDIGSQSWIIVDNITISKLDPPVGLFATPYWYNSKTEVLYSSTIVNGEQIWVVVNHIQHDRDPSNRISCELWWDLETNKICQWSSYDNQWVESSQFIESPSDPYLDKLHGEIGLLWFNPDTRDMKEWDGKCFNDIAYFIWPTRDIAIGTFWLFNGKLLVLTANGWEQEAFTSSDYLPTNIPLGTYWVDPGANKVYRWNGLTWNEIWFTDINPIPQPGDLWIKSPDNILYKWDEELGWIRQEALLFAYIDCNGNVVIENRQRGSASFVEIVTDKNTDDLWKHVSSNKVLKPVPGTDSPSDVPSYIEDGVGTDGSDAIRNEIANDIRYDLGYPIVDVELTPTQLDLCITKALELIRQRSSAAYKRSFFMISITSNNQRYMLTDKTLDHHKIVTITRAARLTSAFLSSAHGSGVYGQIVLQQLYNMGTFDLTSYHLMSNYINTMEMLFANRLAFNFDERTRELWIHNRFAFNEQRVLLDCTVERTEQEIMTDRLILPSIRKLASAYAKLQLSEIRGKFSQLPSASGGVSLNASDLAMKANSDIEQVLADIEMFVTDRPEEYGLNDFTWG